MLPTDTSTSQFLEWVGVKRIGVAMSYRIEKKSQKKSLEYRYYISSGERDKSQFATAVRDH